MSKAAETTLQSYRNLTVRRSRPPTAAAELSTLVCLNNPPWLIPRFCFHLAASFALSVPVVGAVLVANRAPALVVLASPAILFIVRFGRMFPVVNAVLTRRCSGSATPPTELIR